MRSKQSCPRCPVKRRPAGEGILNSYLFVGHFTHLPVLLFYHTFGAFSDSTKMIAVHSSLKADRVICLFIALLYHFSGHTASFFVTA